LLLLRVILPLAVLLLAGFGIAYLVTKDRRFLRYLVLSMQIELLLIVAFGVLYVLERVFLL
jgi:hypothetical protein